MKISKEEFDAALVALDKYEQPGIIPFSPWVRPALLKESAPNRYKLYRAGWLAGFTVNGMKPEDALHG